MLLLLRAGKHNAGKWGLPGGNVEPGDGQELLSTATREAVEEMGSVPPFEVRCPLPALLAACAVASPSMEPQRVP